MKTSCTALEQPSSMVKRSLSQSAEAPSFFSWLIIFPPYSSFHSQACFKNSSLPISFLSMPCSFSFSITFTSVAIAAWSVPGCQRASYPCILLKRMRISCMVSSRACPMCSCPVTFGGGITMVNGFLSLFTWAWKYLLSSHFW